MGVQQRVLSARQFSGLHSKEHNPVESHVQLGQMKRWGSLHRTACPGHYGEGTGTVLVALVLSLSYFYGFHSRKVDTTIMYIKKFNFKE